MRKLIFLLVIAASFTACKNSKKGTTSEAKLLRGEFIHTADAAVLKGEDFIYGVELGGLTEELSKQVEPLKREEFDMVPVVIMGIVKPNPAEEGWDEVVEITEIMGTEAPTSDLATKIKTTDEENATIEAVPEGAEEDHSGHDHE